MKKRIIYTAVVFAAFFGLSVAVSIRETKPDVKRLDLKLTALAELLAAAAPSTGTGGVRGVATFVKGAVDGIDTMLLNIKNSGILGNTGVFTHTTPEGLKFRLDTQTPKSVMTRAFPAGKTYTNSFEIWRASDGVKLMELFFDSATDPSQQDGVAAIWWPAGVDPANNTGTGMIECVTTGGSADGTMTCTLTGGPWDANGIFQTIFVKAVANSTAGTVSVKALAHTKPLTDPCVGANNTDVYALAFIAKSAAPNYTTGMWGLNDNSVADSICAVPAFTPNPNNYSYFNTDTNPNAVDDTQYWVDEGSTSPVASDPNYPAGADVLALFDTMANATDLYMNLTTVNTPGTVIFRLPLAPGF